GDKCCDSFFSHSSFFASLIISLFLLLQLLHCDDSTIHPFSTSCDRWSRCVAVRT
ncbi:unnamed protein product, partial [Brassica oleracea var. botrytis]